MVKDHPIHPEKVMPTKINILFLDEEEYVLKALQRSFRKMENEWNAKYANSIPEALNILSKETIDVVVTEIRMKQMSGLDFLAQLRINHPGIVRIILSGYSDRDIILKTVEIAHQYISKPFDIETLKSTINRAFMMRDLLLNDSLRRIVSRIDTLPSLPDLYVEIIDELNSEDASLENVGQIISKDPGMTAKILQIVNSAFFWVSRKISNPTKAVSMLGLDLVKAIVLTAGAFSDFKNIKFPGFSIEDLWSHGLKTGTYAKAIAQHEHLNKEEIDSAFTAGLIHDVGKLLIAENFPEKFKEIHETMSNTDQIFYEAEYEILNAGHAEIGAYLLGLWGLPNHIISAVAFHHQPGRIHSDSLESLTIVHVADAIANAGENDESIEKTLPGVDYDYMENLGLTERLPIWRKILVNE